MSTHIGDGSAAQRNKKPIFDALVPWLEQATRVLEVGAGDATHALYAIERLPNVVWQTSEAPAHHRHLLAALADQDETRLLPPLGLDVRSTWPDTIYDVVYAANVAHIMDWSAVEALFSGAAAHLSPAGLLCLYGPFKCAGETLAPGNAEFDTALRARDLGMGLREVNSLDGLAGASRMERVADIAMPSNNRLLIWQRVG